MHPSYPPTWSQTLSFFYKSQVYPTWREIKLSLGLLASALTQEELGNCLHSYGYSNKFPGT